MRRQIRGHRMAEPQNSFLYEETDDFIADYDAFYDWRSTVSEDIQGAIDELDQDVIELKPVNNYVKGRNGKPTVSINPNVDLKEAVEELGGEMILLDDLESISYIAADYFIEQGLDDYDIAVLKEEMGLDEFNELVMEIYDNYVINEARRDPRARIAPRTREGKHILELPKGGARTSAFNRLKRLGAERRLAGQQSDTPTRADELRAQRLERQRQLASGEVQPRPPKIFSASGSQRTPSEATPKSTQQSSSAQQIKPTLMLPLAGGTNARFTGPSVSKKTAYKLYNRELRKFERDRERLSQQRQSPERQTVTTTETSRKTPSSTQARLSGPVIPKSPERDALAHFIAKTIVAGDSLWQGHQQAMKARKGKQGLLGQLAAGVQGARQRYGEYFPGKSNIKEFVEYLIDEGYDISEISLMDLYEEIQYLEEKAVSEQQQKIFGLALSVKRGDTPRSEVSRQVLEIVDSMSEREIRKFARTKHSGIPKRIVES